MKFVGLWHLYEALLKQKQTNKLTKQKQISSMLGKDVVVQAAAG
jgi:hypothetical protein